MKTKKESNHISLKELSSFIIQKMQELGNSRNQDIVSIVLNQVGHDCGDDSKKDPIRRRCYDVINVLIAAGIIEKNKKNLYWRGYYTQLPLAFPVMNSEDMIAQEKRIKAKEEALRFKIELLTLYKAIVAKNFGKQRPSNAISFPLIIIGISNYHPDLVQRSANQITIPADNTTDFWSPLDVLKNMQIPKQLIKKMQDCTPEFDQIRNLKIN